MKSEQSVAWVFTECHSDGKLAVVLDDWLAVESAIENALIQARIEASR